MFSFGSSSASSLYGRRSQGRPIRSTTSSRSRADPIQDDFEKGFEVLQRLMSDPSTGGTNGPNQTNIDRAFQEVATRVRLTPEDLGRAERLEDPPAHLDFRQFMVYMVRLTASKVGSRNPAAATAGKHEVEYYPGMEFINDAIWDETDEAN
ncbi:hypothetical protein CYLTODRAFT_493620 [Cylindrobasidium torrendii FP15055 ss-10]|uniref:Uncharacterized protein n=1 Tax=Cylindrobasidium torrendii FP15055 ss-10 TaxID=1314674 RepID=A0A0D7AZL4_9AGAR|nr:hypothetical protein CYLTODRAFT_493620 [Cylindrobasidium torrendii FP15055 ss-10]